MNTFDIVMIVLIIFGAYRGWKYGFLSSALSLVGSLAIFVISFYLKNPLSILLYENCPFITFKGLFAGITSVNILLYESIAYIICVILLSVLLKIFLKVTGLVDKLIRLTFVFALPSRILGLIFGALQYYILVFFICFVCTIIPSFSSYLSDSAISTRILDETPILSGVTSNLYDSFKEVYDICIDTKNKQEENKKVEDYKALEVLMKNKIITSNSVKKLVENNKIQIENVDELITKYEEK